MLRCSRLVCLRQGIGQRGRKVTRLEPVAVDVEEALLGPITG